MGVCDCYGAVGWEMWGGGCGVRVGGGLGGGSWGVGAGGLWGPPPLGVHPWVRGTTSGSQPHVITPHFCPTLPHTSLPHTSLPHITAPHHPIVPHTSPHTSSHRAPLCITPLCPTHRPVAPHISTPHIAPFCPIDSHSLGEDFYHDTIECCPIVPHCASPRCAPRITPQIPPLRPPSPPHTSPHSAPLCPTSPHTSPLCAPRCITPLRPTHHPTNPPVAPHISTPHIAPLRPTAPHTSPALPPRFAQPRRGFLSRRDRALPLLQRAALRRALHAAAVPGRADRGGAERLLHMDGADP